MENSNTLYDILIKNKANKDTGITFIKDSMDETYLSYHDLYEKALDMLYFLQLHKLHLKSKLIIYIEDNEVFLTVFWACILGNIIPIPISTGNFSEYRNKLIKVWIATEQTKIICIRKNFLQLTDFIGEVTEDILNQSQKEELGQSFIVVDEYDFSEHKGNMNQPTPQDTALIQFSSGSTGEPKGILLSHRNIIANISSMGDMWKFTPQDITLNWMPLTHDMGLIGVHLLSSYVKLQQYIMPSDLFIKKPLLWLEKVNQHRITGLYSPNFGYKYFLSFYSYEKDYKWDLTCVRYITNGAEPISVDLCKEFMLALNKYQLAPSAMKAIYGLGEASAAVTLTPIEEGYRTVIADRLNLNFGNRVIFKKSKTEQDILLADVGEIVDNCEVRICDMEQNEVAEYVIGNILIRGLNVTKGYLNGKQRDEEEWLETGDMGFIYNKRLVITGRRKEMLCVNGQNYYPYDIERITESYDKIKIWRSAACSYYDRKKQIEKTILFIVYKRNIASLQPILPELQYYIYQKTGLLIDTILPVRELPMTTSGKIKRYQLTDRYLLGEYDKTLDILNQNSNTIIDFARQSINSYEDILSKVIMQIMQINHLDKEQNIFSLGVSSMHILTITHEINRYFRNQITVPDLFTYKSVKQIAQYIFNKNLNSKLFFIKRKHNYFNAEKNEIILQFENSIYNKIIDFAIQLKVCPDIIVIGFVIKFLHEHFQKVSFSFQIMTRLEEAIFIQVDFEQINSFTSLIAQIQKQLKQTQFFSIQEITCQNFDEKQNAIIPLLEIVKKGGLNTSLPSFFDVIAKYYHMNECIKFIFVYNNTINTSVLKEYMEAFYHMIRQFMHVWYED